MTRYVFGPRDFGSQFNAWQYNAFGGESHLLRQSVIFRTPNKSRKVKNLYYVGAGTLPGIGLPMCLIGAEMVYKKIVGNPSDGPSKGQIYDAVHLPRLPHCQFFAGMVVLDKVFFRLFLDSRRTVLTIVIKHSSL